ncbi:MAG TPA: hypothetical protein VIM73_07180 [Polyangiaceae bacterium]
MSRWQLGPLLEINRSDSRTRPLADGRLLTCLEEHEGNRCQIVDPLDGQTRVIPVRRIEGLSAAIALDDGNLLLPHARVILDLETGSTRPLPPTKHELGRHWGTALSGGRAAFTFPDRPLCHRLLLFLGMDQGFREIDAIGSGVAAGGALGFGVMVKIAQSKPDMEGLGPLLLAVPVSIAGAAAGGIAAGVASKEPGAARFAASAVPLSALWLTSAVLTIDAW